MLRVNTRAVLGSTIGLYRLNLLYEAALPHSDRRVERAAGVRESPLGRKSSDKELTLNLDAETQGGGSFVGALTSLCFWNTCCVYHVLLLSSGCVYVKERKNRRVWCLSYVAHYKKSGTT